MVNRETDRLSVQPGIKPDRASRQRILCRQQLHILRTVWKEMPVEYYYYEQRQAAVERKNVRSLYGVHPELPGGIHRIQRHHKGQEEIPARWLPAIISWYSNPIIAFEVSLPFITSLMVQSHSESLSSRIFTALSPSKADVSSDTSVNPEMDSIVNQSGSTRVIKNRPLHLHRICYYSSKIGTLALRIFIPVRFRKKQKNSAVCRLTDWRH